MEDFLYKYLSFYGILPQPIKQFIGRLYSYLPNRFKYGPFYYLYAERLRSFFQMGSLQEIEREQNKLLFSQVNRSIEQIPFYRHYKKISSLEEFRILPVIDKNTIREKRDELINPLLPGKKIIANTGGSSGTPLEFYIEKGVSRSKEKAHFDWYWHQFGYKPFDKMLMIRGLPLAGKRLYEFRTIDNILNISCYNINKNNIQEVLVRINQFRPKFIHAYPSSLKVITSLLEQHKKKLDFSITAIFLGSEYLNENDRCYFEGFYNARIVNWYGHSERLIHGGNCPFSNEYHFYPSYGFIELLDENNQVINHPGKEGRIVATGFDNRIMPFIRYDTGDLGVLSDQSTCKCGFKGVSLQKIAGRGHDLIVLSDGTQVSLTAFIFGQHLEAFKRISEMQVVQHKIGEIELRIVKNSDFTPKDEENTKKTLLNSVNNKIIIDFNYVESIPKTSRGKNVFFISSLKKN